MGVKSLFKKSTLYFIGNLASKMLNLFLIPVFAFFITAKDLGYYDVILTIMGIFVPIVFLAIWEAILRFILVEENSIVIKRMLSTITIFILLVSMFVLISSIFVKKIWSIEYIYLIVLTFISYALSQIWQYYARAFKENLLYVKASILGAGFNFFVVIFMVIIFKFGIIGLLIAYIIGQLSVFILIESKLRIISKVDIKSFDIKILKNVLTFSAPLVVNLVSLWLVTGFGRFLISQELGVQANGLFSFATKFSMIIIMIGSVVTMAVIEEAIIASENKKLDNNFSNIINKVFVLFQLLCLLFIPIITIFYIFIKNTEYYVSINYSVWMLLFALATTMGSMVGAIFQAINKTKYQFITSIIGGFLTVIISISLISSIGVSAVVLGQILGAFGMLISRYVLVKKYTGFYIKWNYFILFLFIFTILSIVCIQLELFSNILILIILISGVMYFNKSNIVKAKLLIQKKFK